MKKSVLVKHLNFWKDTLGLGAWTITVEFESSPAKVSNACADVLISNTTRDAKITILRHRYRKGRNRIPPLDYEIDLVHELLHIYVDKYWKPRNPSAFQQKEIFIEALARTLVSLRRGKPDVFLDKV